MLKSVDELIQSFQMSKKSKTKQRKKGKFRLACDF